VDGDDYDDGDAAAEETDYDNDDGDDVVSRLSEGLISS
jgi:hypothetical protein